MDLRIEPLSGQLAKTFVKFFESMNFDHAPHWATCYCRFYHTDTTQDEWMERKGGKNRKEALEEIRAGRMKGYLAFDGTRCVGWLNANHAESYVRLAREMMPVVGDKKVGVVICYVIHPEYRRKGISKAMLKRAVEDFRSEGYEAVIALPIEPDENWSPEKKELLYRGHLGMYEDFGFKEIQQHGNLHVMWLKL